MLNVTSSYHFKCLKSSFQKILLLGSLLLVSCVEPPAGTSIELIKINPPTFAGSSSQNFTTPTPQYVLVGGCDSRSYGIEYSFDAATWIEIPGGCQNEQFSIPLTVTAYKKVYARAKSKMGYTSSAFAWVRLALPPTTASYQTVVAGSAVGVGEPGIPFTMGHAFTGERLTGVNFRLNSSLTGIVYGEP